VTRHDKTLPPRVTVMPTGNSPNQAGKATIPSLPAPQRPTGALAVPEKPLLPPTITIASQPRLAKPPISSVSTPNYVSLPSEIKSAGTPDDGVLVPKCCDLMDEAIDFHLPKNYIRCIYCGIPCACSSSIRDCRAYTHPECKSPYGYHTMIPANI